MSSTNIPRYIEFDSTRRNRVSYPEPAQFNISMNPQNITAATAVDPVYLSYPIFSFTTGFALTGTLEDSIQPSISPPNIGNASDNSLIVLNFTPPLVYPTNVAQQLKDYYVGACIIITNSSLGVSNTRRITTYDYIGVNNSSVPPGNARAIITVFPPFSDSLLIQQDYANCTFSINDPTDLSNIYYPQVFIPNGLPQPNAYVNLELYNETIPTGDYRTISYYDEVTRLVTLNCVNNPLTPDWQNNININFSFQRTGNIITLIQCTFYDTSTIILVNPAVNGNIYTGNYTRTIPTEYVYYDPQYLPQESKIVSYGGESTYYTLLTYPGLAAPNILVPYSSIQLPTGGPYPGAITDGMYSVYNGPFFFTCTLPLFEESPGSGNTITIGSGNFTVYILNATDYPYPTNNFIMTIQNSTQTFGYSIQNPGYIFTISSDTINVTFTIYDGVNTTTFNAVLPQGLTPEPCFFAASGNIGNLSNTYQFDNIAISGYRSGILKVFPPFPVLPIATQMQLIQFSYDNPYPFVYSGKDREVSTYKVDLVNLILPNITLNCGYGGRIAYYPYVYVQITNTSATSVTNNLILSNNPNSSAMVFRCPVSDINHPERTPFIKLYSNDMSQTFRFTPYDILAFEVILPSGELYTTVMKDNYSPLAPNYRVQISAIFRFEKLG